MVSKLSLASPFDCLENKTRIGGGFKLPFRGEARTFTARTVVEYNWLPRGLTYNRFQERFPLRWTRLPLRPRIMAEVMAGSPGWAAARKAL